MLYDPDMVNQMNLTDPEELEAHLQILDVRERLRRKRQRTVRLFSVAFVLVVATILVSVGLMSSDGGGGPDESGRDGNTLTSDGSNNDSLVPTNPTDNATTTAPSKKEEIEMLCGIELETTTTPGGDSCESLCSVSYCCFNHFCVAPPDIDCLDYSACFALYADIDDMTGQDNNTPGLGDDIHEACSGLLDVNVAATNEACKSACAAGACCFEPSLTCGGVDCSMYADCIILHPSFIAVSKEEVTDACTNHNNVPTTTAEHTPTLCEQVCSLHVMQCCFHSGGDCDDTVLLGDNKVYCDVYQACEVLGTDPSTLRVSHKVELDEACDGGAASRSHCIQLCSSATCCYATKTEEACANVGSTVTCSDYKACDILYG